MTVFDEAKELLLQFKGESYLFGSGVLGAAGPVAAGLGGYAIMIGGTNGGHLTSFSLVDLLPHGRACALMNPYYTVFFAPAIEQPLRLVAELFNRAGWADADVARRSGRELGIAVAEAMMRFADGVGFPTTFAEVAGFAPAHIERALAAAKDPTCPSH